MNTRRPFFGRLFLRTLFSVGAFASVATFLFAIDSDTYLSPKTANALIAVPTSDLVVHEWGVWRIEQGNITHLNDLQRELPPLVNVAANAAPIIQPTPRDQDHRYT